MHLYRPRPNCPVMWASIEEFPSSFVMRLSSFRGESRRPDLKRSARYMEYSTALNKLRCDDIVLTMQICATCRFAP